MEGSGDALGAFGALLGASCALLGRLLDALGRLIGISWGSWALKARFWVDFGGVWEGLGGFGGGFGRVMGGFWEAFGQFLDEFGGDFRSWISSGFGMSRHSPPKLGGCHPPSVQAICRRKTPSFLAFSLRVASAGFAKRKQLSGVSYIMNED